MNILTDLLPTRFTVGTTTFAIDTDFRACIKFSLMVETGETDVFKLCEPFFPKGLPVDIEGATEAILYLFRGGESVEETTQKQSKAQAYSFDVDSNAIYADFWQYYRINLAHENLHWWAFRSLLMGLPEDSNFKKRIYYRTCELKGLSKGERKRIETIRKEITIKNTETIEKITLEQRNKQMLDYVAKRSRETRGCK